MFGRLMRQYRYDQKPPEFLLTHPVSESRIADTTNRAEHNAQGGTQDSLRYQLMRARTQLKFESTPGVGAKRFRAMLDENPRDGRRPLRTGAEMKAGQLADAASSLEPLLAKAPDDLTYNLAQVELDITANRLQQAQRDYSVAALYRVTTRCADAYRPVDGAGRDPTSRTRAGQTGRAAPAGRHLVSGRRGPGP